MLKKRKLCLNVYSLENKNIIFGFCTSCGFKPKYDVFLNYVYLNNAIKHTLHSYELCEKCKNLVVKNIRDIENKNYSQKITEAKVIEIFNKIAGAFLNNKK